MIGTTLGHYRVLAPLGRGGMGEVFVAEDMRLGRRVALKTLPRDIAHDPGRQARFEGEARAVATLSHPNIVALYEFGEDRGIAFAVMELLEGDTLRARLASGLPLRKALECARAVAEGLDTAHRKGIVHRDLKPENVFITRDGQTKILDFGLARADPGETADSHLMPTAAGTEPGQILGTVGYMSPEQVRGERADARSDIFALGAILYEMLSGRRAFGGQSPADVIGSVLRDDPPALPAGVSQARTLDTIVRRCLENNREERFQSARDVAFALDAAIPLIGSALDRPHPESPTRKRWSWVVAIAAAVLVAAAAILSWQGWSRRGAATNHPIKIAVLPFENLGTPEDEYFASGLTDEITTRLAAIDGVGVISRNSTLSYAGSRKSVAVIGKELAVDYLVTGTVRWQRATGPTGRLRVAPTLIRVSDDTHVWAQSYDRTLGEIIGLQDDIAGQVTSVLGRKLPGRTNEEPTTANVDAYQAYLRGLHHDSGRDRISEPNTALAAQMFERAVQLDPGFALAHARLSIVYSNRYRLGYERTAERLQRAREEAEQSRRLAPGSAWADVAMGYYHYTTGDYALAVDALEKAATRLSGEEQVFRGLGAVRRRSGQLRESLAGFNHALDIDVRSADLHREVASTYGLMREYTQALRYFDQSIALEPDQLGVYWEKARVQVLSSGSTADAETTLELMPRTGDPGLLAWAHVQIPLLARRYDAVLSYLETEAPAVISNQERFLPRDLALAGIYRLTGKGEQARMKFESAVSQLERERDARPSDGRVRAALGMAYAGMGRKSEAVSEARRAVSLAGPESDAMTGPVRVYDLARVFVAIGDLDGACAALDEVLSIPSYYSAKWIEIDPEFDPLRAHPDYATILRKHGLR